MNKYRDTLECDEIGNLPENSYPLDDLYDLSFSDNYSSFINSMTTHGGAVSVRYVFEPQYR